VHTASKAARYVGAIGAADMLLKAAESISGYFGFDEDKICLYISSKIVSCCHFLLATFDMYVPCVQQKGQVGYMESGI
jgi:hypothetical protein